MVFLGRRSECEALDRLLDAVRSGESRALVLRGEAGIGKTALLDYLAEQAAGCRVARAAGVESEMELAFAGLHQLCAPLLDRLDAPPGPAARRAAARRSACSAGAAAGPLPGRPGRAEPAGRGGRGAAAGRASSTTRSGSTGPRRRRSRSSRAGCWPSRSALVFAVPRARPSGRARRAAGAASSTGCGDDDARALLDSALPGPLDERVRDRIVAETRGNPLALLELPRGLTPAELAGGFGLPDARPAGRAAIEAELPARGSRRCRPTTRQLLLLVAAAEPSATPRCCGARPSGSGIGARRGGARRGRRADRARRPGAVPPSAGALGGLPAAPRERAPRGAPRAGRGDRPEPDPDRRAWHRAQAAAGPDEDVAAELERSAGRAAGAAAGWPPRPRSSSARRS